MKNDPIAVTLLHNLNLLIDSVADDPVLHRGLLRERRRLLFGLGCPSEVGLPLPSRSAPCGSIHRPRRRLRASCYEALFSGLLSGRRFDVMMLLSARARRSAQRASAAGMSAEPEATTADAGPPPMGAAPASQVGSPSPSLSLSPSGGDAGSGGAGSTGRVWPVSRRKRISASTIRTCA